MSAGMTLRFLRATTAADTLNSSASVRIFECVGTPGVIQRIMDGAPRDARIVIVGVYVESDRFEPFFGILKQLNLQFVLGYTAEEFAASLRHIADGTIDVAPLITGSVGLQGVKDAFTDLAIPTDTPGRSLAVEHTFLMDQFQQGRALGRRAGLFADKLLTGTVEIALRESIGIRTGSHRRSRESSRRIVDATAALAHARARVAVHHTGSKGLRLRLDRGQRWRYRRDRDGLLRKANRRTFIRRRRWRPHDAENQNTHGEPRAHADLHATFFSMKPIESSRGLSIHFGSERPCDHGPRPVCVARKSNPINRVRHQSWQRRNPTGEKILVPSAREQRHNHQLTVAG
jgi:hypothetical protein